MNIFLDTEFTDFADMDLISIGLVADDGREFYGERYDFELHRCSDFTSAVVLPLLGNAPRATFKRNGLRDAVSRWLGQYERQKPVICYDYAGDNALLWDLLDRSMPPWLAMRNVYYQIDAVVLEAFWHATGLPQHHALYDARANSFAYRPKAT